MDFRLIFGEFSRFSGRAARLAPSRGDLKFVSFFTIRNGGRTLRERSENQPKIGPNALPERAARKMGPQEAPGGPRRLEEAPGGPRRLPIARKH